MILKSSYRQLTSVWGQFIILPATTFVNKRNRELKQVTVTCYSENIVMQEFSETHFEDNFFGLTAFQRVERRLSSIKSVGILSNNVFILSQIWIDWLNICIC